MRFDNVMFASVLLAHKLLKELQDEKAISMGTKEGLSVRRHISLSDIYRIFQLYIDELLLEEYCE